jgi:spermidine synthase
METTPGDNDAVRASVSDRPVATDTGWPNTRLWQPNLIVFISNACIMILELVAGRIIAPHVGVSLYTWTSIIGVVLAGISLGNYLGGRLADRWASLRLLGGVFLLGGLSSIGILSVDMLPARIPDGWPIIAEILTIASALFFIPSLILGTISPIVARLAVRDLAKTGSTVGKIYAAGTLGSIVGTFATGFVLISWFGTHVIVWGVALVLISLGLVFLLRGSRPLMLLAALILAAGSLRVQSQGWLRGLCTRESNYFCIRVDEDERNGKPVRVLTLDRLVHSYTSLTDPTQLVYTYEQMYAQATAYRAQEEHHLRALFIGGGGYTFPRYMEALYPQSDIDVIEIDPAVTQVAHDMLGLDRATRVVTFNEDARMFLRREPAQAYDLIIGDAFNDFSVPYHLTTKQFNDRVSAWLADDGLYLVNIIDGHRGDFLRAFVHTLRHTFRHVYVAPTTESWRRLARGTFVLIASDVPLERAAQETASADEGESPLTRLMLDQEEVDALLTGGRVVLLTDQYAPVDQMLAPVFRDEEPG